MLLIGVTGDELDLLQEARRVDPSSVVITQNLDETGEKRSEGPKQDNDNDYKRERGGKGGGGGGSDATKYVKDEERKKEI